MPETAKLRRTDSHVCSYTCMSIYYEHLHNGRLNEARKYRDQCVILSTDARTHKYLE